MGFVDAIKVCFGKYADFSGRAMRPEFWFFCLFVFVLSMITSGLDLMFGTIAGADPNVPGSGVFILNTLFTLATLVPMLSVTARRLHDIDRSGWWMLIGLIPIIGWIVLIYFEVLDGSFGTNRFGPDPKGRDPLDEALDSI